MKKRRGVDGVVVLKSVSDELPLSDDLSHGEDPTGLEGLSNGKGGERKEKGKVSDCFGIFKLE